MLGVAYGKTGQLSRSIDHFQKAATTGGFRVYSYLGDALIRDGRPDEARGLLDEINAAPPETFISPLASAVIEAELGNMSRGLDLLEEAWRLRVVHLVWAGVDDVFAVFRGQPRFQAILRELGLRD
jgi:hypothetical protein